MAQTSTKTLTIEDVESNPPRVEGRWELIDGEVVVMPAASYWHNIVAANIYDLLRDWDRERRHGRVLINDTGFVIRRNPDRMRAPDVAFVRRERDTPHQPGFFRGAPDLAVEVVSPDDREQEVLEKVDDWLDAGGEVIWVVWPTTRSVTIHRRGVDTSILHEGDTIEDNRLLPGFRAAVSDFFRA
jgi:Uma2 family endonuclease